MRIRNIIITTVKAQRKDAKKVGEVILDKDEQIRLLRAEVRALKNRQG